MPDEPAVDPKVILKLSSKKALERSQAEEALEALGQEAVDALMALLRKETEAFRRRRRLIQWGIAAYVVLCMTVAVFERDLVVTLSAFTGFVGLAASQVQKNAARKLAEFDDVRIVGHLAAQLDMQDNDLRKLVLPRLTQLLPRLRASDAAYITPEQHEALTRALRRPNLKKEAPFIEALVRAMEQIGTEEDLEPVKRLAMEDGPAARHPAIRQAAIECLPALEERVERQREANTLLRAAAAPATPQEALLRPASAGAAPNPAQLLRPAGDMASQQDFTESVAELQSQGNTA